MAALCTLSRFLELYPTGEGRVKSTCCYLTGNRTVKTWRSCMESMNKNLIKYSVQLLKSETSLCVLDREGLKGAAEHCWVKLIYIHTYIHIHTQLDSQGCF